MPAQLQQRPAATTAGAEQAPAAAGGGRQDRLGNAAVAEQLAAAGGLYGQLRAKLGDKLAELITEHLSEAELLALIQPALSDFLAEARAEVSGGEHGLTDAELAQAFGTLDTRLGEAAQELLGRLDADGRLSRLAQAQPELVALTALAGVVAWALSTNVDLPEIDTDKDLGGGHSLGGAIDLGRIKSLTVEHLEARWSFDGARTDASARVWGGPREGGVGAEGDLEHALEAGVLSLGGRGFRGDDQSEARGHLGFDGARTDARLSGDWRQDADGTDWGLDALLTHDGAHTDARLEAALDQADGQRTGHVAGSLVHERDGWRRHLDGRLGLDGAWDAEAGVRRQDGDRRWSLTGAAEGGAGGPAVGSLSGTWADTHDGFTSAASGRAATDGTWDARGALTGTDAETPWSLTGRAGQTAADTGPDWEVTGKYGRALDPGGHTRLSGTQMLGRDRSLSRLDLSHELGDTRASAWLERSRADGGVTDALGGSLETRLGAADAYARGWIKSDQTWEASAGISSGTESDDLSWFAEAYSGRDALGQEDHGARAGLKWRF